MVKHKLNDIFTDLNSESSVILPKSIKIKNIKSVDTISNTTSSFMPQKEGYSDATSSFMPQKGGYSDATSSFMPQKGGYSDATSSFMPQKGGYSDATSSFMPQKGGNFSGSNKKTNKDINQLISMLSATSDNNYTTNSTDTEQLKDKLFNILQTGGDDNEHTHIIYVCCLIDINVVIKLKELMDKQQDKKYRVYINCNPYNIFGFRFQGGVFGESSYSGVIELHRLLIKSNILGKKLFRRDQILTYYDVINFINTLKNVYKIILFDSPDYLLKSWMVEKEITLDEAIEIVNNSQLIDKPEEREKIIKFLEQENKEQKPIKRPFDFYETNLKDIPYDNVDETYGYDRIKEGKEQTPAIFQFVKDNIIEEYNTQYIEKFKKNVYRYNDPIRKFEHKRLLTELINKHGTENDVKKVLLELLENPNVNSACTKYPRFYPYKKFLEIFQKWVSSFRFQQKSPKVLFDFTGFLFICMDGNIDNIIVKNNIMSDNLVVKIFDVNKFQKMIIQECEKKNPKNPHDEVLPLIKNIINKHNKLNKVSLIVDCESDDLLTMIVCNEHLPQEISLDIYIQKNNIINETSFDTVETYLDSLIHAFPLQVNKNTIAKKLTNMISTQRQIVMRVAGHESNKKTVIDKLQTDLNSLRADDIHVNDEIVQQRIKNIEQGYIIKNKINLRFILSILKEKLDYSKEKISAKLTKNSLETEQNGKPSYVALLKMLSADTTETETVEDKDKKTIQFISFNDKKKWTIYKDLLNNFYDEIIQIANNEYDSEIKENKKKIDEFVIQELRLIYPFIQQKKIEKFKENTLDVTNSLYLKPFEDIETDYVKFNEDIQLLLKEAKKNLKKIVFKENDITALFKCNNIPINFNKLYTLYDFYLTKFKNKYDRAKYYNIDIDLYEKLEHLRPIVPNIHHLDLTFEFFKIEDSIISINQEITKISLSPNILKSLDALYQLFKLDNELLKIPFPTYTSPRHIRI